MRAAALWRVALRRAALSRTGERTPYGQGVERCPLPRMWRELSAAARGAAQQERGAAQRREELDQVKRQLAERELELDMRARMGARR